MGVCNARIVSTLWRCHHRGFQYRLDDVTIVGPFPPRIASEKGLEIFFLPRLKLTRK